MVLFQIDNISYSTLRYCRKKNEVSSAETSKAAKEKPKRASSPIRRSQRQQDKIIKDQVERIRAENAEAQLRELEELARRAGLSKDEGTPKDAHEVAAREPIVETAIKNAENLPDKADTATAEPKPKTRQEDSESNKDAADVAEKVVKSSEGKIAAKQPKVTKAEKDVTKGAKKINKPANRKSLEIHKNDTGRFKERKSSLGKNYKMSGVRVRRESTGQQYEGSVEGHIPELCGESSENHEPKKEKKVLKKDKSPGIAYLSVEPALFSKPDVMVLKGKSEEGSTKPEEATTKPKHTDVPKLEKDSGTKVESMDKSASVMYEPDVQPTAFKTITDKMKSILSKVQAKVNVASKPSAHKSETATHEGAAKATLAPGATKRKEVAPSTHKHSNHNDQPETLNDIIAALTNHPPKAAEEVVEMKSESTEKPAIAEKVLEEMSEEELLLDSARRSYPKRENRRIPAHFKMYDRELTPPPGHVLSEKKVEEEKSADKVKEPTQPKIVEAKQKKVESRKAIGKFNFSILR